MEKHNPIFDAEKIQFGCKKDTCPDPRTYQYEDRIVGVEVLPISTDLRPLFNPVCNQGGLNSCQSFAVVSVLEAMWKRDKKEFMDFSELFQYYYIRAARQKTDLNVGAYIIDAIKSPLNNGFVRESSWQYIQNKFTTKPGTLAQVERNFWKLYLPKSYYKVISLDGIKHALAENRPVVFGMNVKDSFMSTTANKTNEGNNRGGHAMVIVGHDDTQEYFIVRNSWGTSWGASGYCYIPYKYFSDMFDLYVYL